MRSIPKIPEDHQIYGFKYLWWGVCIGGRHYTGKVHWREGDEFKTHELERRLSLREAKEISGEKEILWKHHDRVTVNFDSLEQLERAAIKWVEKNATVPNWLLIHNDYWNPNRPIAAAGLYKKRVKSMRAFADFWAKVDDSKREIPEVWDATYNAWYAFFI